MNDNMAGSRFRGRRVQRGKFLGGVVLRNVLRNVPRMQRGSGGGKLSKKLASVEKTRRRFSIPGI